MPFRWRWWRLEAGQAVQILRDILLHLQHIVDNVSLIIHSRLIRCIFPDPVHYEFVLHQVHRLQYKQGLVSRNVLAWPLFSMLLY